MTGKLSRSAVVLLACALLLPLLVVASPSADAATADFTWSRPGRLSRTDASTDMNSPTRMRARAFDVVLDGCGAQDAQYYEWTIALEASPEIVVASQRDPSACSWTWPSPLEADYRISLETAPGVATEQTVPVFDLFIAILGDSYTSGEGAPDVAEEGAFVNVQWRDRQCHRSSNSWAFETAQTLEDESDRHAVSLAFLACSGAKIAENPLIEDDERDDDAGPSGGLLQPYEGIDPPPIARLDVHGQVQLWMDPETGEPIPLLGEDGLPWYTLPPQVEQLRELIVAAGRAPDMVLMSGGGNDIEFAKIIEECVVFNNCRKGDSIDPSLAPHQFGYDRFLRHFETRLPGRLNALYNEVRSTGVDPAGVFVLEYPDLADPLPAEDEGFLADCYQIRRWEWKYIRDAIAAPLNETIGRIAGDYGFTFLDGITEGLAGHGVCGDSSYYQTLFGSLDNQDDKNGAFHPKGTGYDAMRDVTLAAVRPYAAGITSAPPLPQADLPVLATDAVFDAARLVADPTRDPAEVLHALQDGVTFEVGDVSEGVLSYEVRLDGAPYEEGMAVTLTDGRLAERHLLEVRPAIALRDGGSFPLVPERYSFTLYAAPDAVLETLSFEIATQGSDFVSIDGASAGSLPAYARLDNLGTFVTDVGMRVTSSSPDVEVELAILDFTSEGAQRVPYTSGERVQEPIGSLLLEVTARAGGTGEVTVLVPYALVERPSDVQAHFGTITLEGLGFLFGDETISAAPDWARTWAWDEDQERLVRQEAPEGSTSGSYGLPTDGLRIIADAPKLRDVVLLLNNEAVENGHVVAEAGNSSVEVYACINRIARCEIPVDPAAPLPRSVVRIGQVDVATNASNAPEQILEGIEVPPRPADLDCRLGCAFDFSGELRWEQPDVGPPEGWREPERIDGTDPIVTAAAISERRFKQPGIPEHAVVSRDDAFPDSLAGAALTGRGPLLFTRTDALPPSTRDELVRVLEPGATVYVLGGPAAVSEGVVASIESLGFPVTRLQGASRVETSIAVADEVLRLYGQNEIALARAYGAPGNESAGWADSVTSGGWTARTAVPVLVTATEEVHPVLAAWLAEHDIERTVVLGGTAALSADVERAVPAAERVGGAERAATAVEISKELIGDDAEALVAINGYHPDGWAYGLAAAGLAADNGGRVLVTGEELPAATSGELSTCGLPADRERVYEGDTRAQAIGPSQVLPDDVIEEIGALRYQECDE